MADAHAKLTRIAQRLYPGARVHRAWSLTGGISAHNTTLEIALPDGDLRSVVVRRLSDETVADDPDAAAHQHAVLTVLHGAGLPVPAPLWHDESSVVLEHIEGRPAFDPQDRMDFIAQFAAGLARIHSLSGVDSVLPFLPRQVERTNEKLRNHRSALDDSLRESAIRTALRRAWPLPSLNETALLHGDYWPGNLLWHNGRLVAVIDWEDAKLGDPLADLAISRLDILWLLGIDAMHELTQCYRRSMDIDYRNLPWWDLCAALRPVGQLSVWASKWPELGRPDVTVTTLRNRHRWFVEQAFAACGANG